MTFRPHRLAAIIALACVMSGHTVAQPVPAVDDTTMKLINLLVQNDLLTEEQARVFLEEARGDGAGSAPQLEEGDIRVPYIPENVQQDMTEEVRRQVVAQALEENWAQPGLLPGWVSRIRLDADVRIRNESRFYSDYNSPMFIDFHRMNEEGPQDISGPALQTGAWPPFYNTTEDRVNLLRLRARFGLVADISEHWQAGLRVATGSSDDPGSTNQTLGGGLEKKDLWLDRGFISWRPMERLTFTAGRFGNRFVSTDVLYSGDLNFDGLAVQFSGRDKGVSLFGTLGAFPLEFTTDASPSRSEFKTESEDKWLLGAQVGLQWRGNEENGFHTSLAFYEFNNISGERSAPCEPWLSGRQEGYGCSSDWSRPAYLQKGNTLFALRDIMWDPQNPAMTPMPQYVGLASEFQLLDLNLSWQTALFNNMKLRVTGNYIHNLAYDEEEMLQRTGALAQGSTDGLVVNNLDSEGDIDSGSDAWMAEVAVGTAVETPQAGQWNLRFGYKHIEPDALPDAYNDTSFHRGGTNAKGYYVGGAYGFHEHVYGQLRWMSSKEVYGAPLEVDVLQIELNARF